MQEHTELCWLLTLGDRASASSTACTSSATSRSPSASSSRPGCSSIPCSRPPTCSPTAPTRCRSARTSASTSSSCATSPGASTRASARARDARRARAPDPRGRRADHGPPGADAEDVDDRRHREGTVYVLDEPDAIDEEVQARGDRLRTPRSAAPPDKPGVSNLIDILAAVARRHAGEVEAELADARGYGDLKVAVAEAVVAMLAPGPRALRRAARGRGRARGDPRGRRRQGAGDRAPRRSPTCATAMGVGPRRR